MTDKPRRQRRRDINGTPSAVLGMLLLAPQSKVDPDLAAIACQCTRSTIIQAIHRLRKNGLTIHTYPRPPGPQRVHYYRLDDDSRPRAWNMLAWWCEAQPGAWERYKAIHRRVNNDR